jgi:O-antigen/teichoic acid export membrane protein
MAYVIEGLAASAIQLAMYIRLHRDIGQWRFDQRLAVTLLKQSWPLILSSFAIMVYVKIDQIMLGKMQGMEVTGVYAAAARISEIWYFIPTILASSLFPAIIRSKALGERVYHQRLQRYYDVNAGLAYGLIMSLSFGAPSIVRILYGQEYQGAETIVIIHIWASLFVFLGVARGQWLVAEGLLRFSLLATMLGALSNIALNLVCIPLFAGIGAAIATVISYALSGWISSFVSQQTYQNGLLQLQAIVFPVRWFAELFHR